MSIKEILWKPEDFKTVENFYQIFHKAGYNLGDPEKMDPKLIPSLKKTSISKNIEELYQVVYHEMEFQVWLVIAPKRANKRNWRKLIISEVMESYGDYVIFFTKDFSQLWISIISDDIIEEMIFKLDNPSAKIDRFIGDLLNKKPLVDPKGLTASILQAKHTLTAKKLYRTILNKDENNTFLLFKRSGLYIKGDLDLIAPRKEAPLKRSVLKVLISKKSTEENWVKNNLMTIIGEFHESTSENLEDIIVLYKNAFCFYDVKGNLYDTLEYSDKKKDSESLMGFLTSLVSCFDVKAAFNAETFEQQFGEFSPLFIRAKYEFKAFIDNNKKKIDFIKKEWKRFFGKVYQTKDIDEELFIKHTYLSSIIKIVLFCKYLPDKVVNSSNSFVELSEYFESRGIEIFINDFYSWGNELVNIRELLYRALKNADYETVDVFRVIYQDMVSPATRHALGEFYTPPELARLLVEDAYSFGMKVLDPACGSGTFLIQILQEIINSGESLEKQYNAITNIYGFDINPIAVLVSKANLLLHIEELPNKHLPVNVFLTDSIFPLKRVPQMNMEYGIYESFTIAKDQNILINEKFFQIPNKENSYNYLRDFIRFLQYIDELMVRDRSLDNIIQNFDRKFREDWLENNIQFQSSELIKTYKDNLHDIISQLYQLYLEDRDHIWVYLLYNSIGTKLVRNQMDLVIGNPPWIGLNSIYSSEYQNQMKILAKNVGISPSKTANVSNLEISSLFLFQCTEMYLKKNAKIIFLVPRAVNKGSHNDCFRQFKNLKDIEMWDFEKPRPFTEEFVVLAGHKKNREKESSIEIEKRLRMVYRNFQPKFDGAWSFEEYKTKYSENWIPAFVDKITRGSGKKRRTFYSIGRFIPYEIKQRLPPLSKSQYHGKFYLGTHFNPRNLFFVRRIDDHYVCDEDQLKWSKNPWKYVPYKSVSIDSAYIFNIIKSDSLCPFYIFNTYKAFLPIRSTEDAYSFDENMPEECKNHWEFLQSEWDKHRKKKKDEVTGQDIITLWDRLDFHQDLTKPMQNNNFKIVYNASSRIHLKAALVIGEYLIDTSCYYYGVTTEDYTELYYLLAVLNSKLLTFSIIEIKDERNIHKHPFDFPIPLWNPENKLHQDISKYGKLFEVKVKNFVDNWIKKEMEDINKKLKKSTKKKLIPSNIEDRLEIIKSGQKLENAIYNHIDEDLDGLDELVSELLHNEL